MQLREASRIRRSGQLDLIGDQLVNLPHNLLWGLLDANRLISPHEMNSRVFVPSAALQICDLIDVHLVDDALAGTAFDKPCH